MTTERRVDGARFTPRPLRAAVCAALISLVAAGCGGGSPLDNPPDVTNGTVPDGNKLSFAYYQRCINAIFDATLPIVGTGTTATCGSAGCHDDVNGTGGAFRIRPNAADADLAANEATIRATDMYRNFFSAQGEVTFSNIRLSRLVTKPRVQGVLHGGGLIFTSDLDPNVQKLLYWMTNPISAGQNEFTTDLPGGPACP